MKHTATFLITIFLAALAAMGALGLAAVAHAAPEPALGAELLGMFRVVEDKDGFVNARAKASLEGKVVEKVTSGSIVGIEGVEGEWATIADSSGEGRALFIHTSRLKPVKEWSQISGKKGEESATAKIAEMSVKVTGVPFVKADHKITKDKDGCEMVDGHNVWGMDGGIPTTALKLSVKMEGEEVEIPAEATRDVYQPNFDSLVVLTPDKSAKHVIIFMTNSDGAGCYCVAWAFVDGKYVGRTVFCPF